MSSFKEYNNTTFYIGPAGTESGESHPYVFLRVAYATYPFDTTNIGNLIWFGLK